MTTKRFKQRHFDIGSEMEEFVNEHRDIEIVQICQDWYGGWMLFYYE